MTMPWRNRLEASCPLGGVTQCGPVHVRSWEMPERTIKPWRTFGQFALVYLTGGRGRYEDIHGRSQDIKPGDLIFVFPDLKHFYGPTRKADVWQEVYLVFQGPIFDTWMEQGLLSMDRPVVHLEPVETWHRRMVEVVDRQPPDTSAGVLTEICRLQHLLADILGATDPSLGHGRQGWITQARALMDSGLDPHQAARQMHCSYATFRKKFTAEAQIPPARYQARRLIDRACELMHTHHYSDKQIAQQLGFCDEFHFSRRFKQLTGLSPRAYRKQLP